MSSYVCIDTLKKSLYSVSNIRDFVRCKMAVNMGRCEVCGKSLKHKKSGAKFCCDAHRQFAYDNRQRVTKRASHYSLTAQELDDVNAVKKVSHDAAATILKVSSVAGRDLAHEVLDAVWDVMINLGYRVEVGV